MQQVLHEDAHAEDARHPPGGQRRRISDRRSPVRHLPQGIVFQIFPESAQAKHSRHRLPRSRNDVTQRPERRHVEGATASGRHGSLLPSATATTTRCGRIE